MVPSQTFTWPFIVRAPMQKKIQNNKAGRIASPWSTQTLAFRLRQCATGKGLYRLDSATGTIQQYSHNPNDPSSLSNNDVSSSGEDKEGRFWVATTGHLDEFDRRTGKVTRDIPVNLQDETAGYS
jgi:hypothetical protein